MFLSTGFQHENGDHQFLSARNICIGFSGDLDKWARQGYQLVTAQDDDGRPGWSPLRLTTEFERVAVLYADNAQPGAQDWCLRVRTSFTLSTRSIQMLSQKSTWKYNTSWKSNFKKQQEHKGIYIGFTVRFLHRGKTDRINELSGPCQPGNCNSFGMAASHLTIVSLSSCSKEPLEHISILAVNIWMSSRSICSCSKKVK